VHDHVRRLMLVVLVRLNNRQEPTQTPTPFVPNRRRHVRSTGEHEDFRLTRLNITMSHSHKRAPMHSGRNTRGWELNIETVIRNDLINPERVSRTRRRNEPLELRTIRYSVHSLGNPPERRTNALHLRRKGNSEVL